RHACLLSPLLPSHAHYHTLPTSPGLCRPSPASSEFTGSHLRLELEDRLEPTFHISPQQFREEAKRLVDWIADYYEQIEKYPVMAQVAPGAVRASLPPSPPLRGEPFDARIRAVEQKTIPGSTHWQSPSFDEYFPS